MDKLKEIDWVSCVFAGILGFAILCLILYEPEREYDSTDNGTERSGLTLYTDHLTGCQYLEAGMVGGITPRLDGKGNHLGCYQTED